MFLPLVPEKKIVHIPHNYSKIKERHVGIPMHDKGNGRSEKKYTQRKRT